MEEGGGHILIVARRALTEPKMALAGVMVEVFSARSRAPVAAFKAEIILCRSLGRWLWVSACMVKNGYSCERTAWCEAVRKAVVLMIRWVATGRDFGRNG